MSYLKSCFILLPAELISCFLLVLNINQKTSEECLHKKSHEKPWSGTGLRSHLRLIWRFIYHLACCSAKIVLLGEVDSKSVTESSISFQKHHSFKHTPFSQWLGCVHEIFHKIEQVCYPNTVYISLCTGSDLSLVHVNCMLTVASEPCIHKK